MSVSYSANAFNGIMVTNSAAGTSASALVAVQNDLGNVGAISFPSSTYSNASFRNNLNLGSDTGLALLTDNNSANG